MQRAALLLAMSLLAASCYLFGGEPPFSGATGDASATRDAGVADAGGVMVDAALRPDAKAADAATPSDASVSCDGSASVILSVTVGAAHTCAIVNGFVECWGDNERGQLGIGVTDPVPGPVLVHGLDGGILSGVTFVAAGDKHTCAVLSDSGSVVCWGANSFGQLGDNTTADRSTPVDTTVISATAVAAGANHTCALIEGGSVFCWGKDDNMQLGSGYCGCPDAGPCSPFPVPVSDSLGLLQYVQEIAAGGDHTCALMADAGTVTCWGANGSGELGCGASSTALTPVNVTWDIADGGPAPRFQAIAAGRAHTCAIAGGGVFCWGANGRGQLGTVGRARRLQPDLSAPTFVINFGVRPIAAGADTTCAFLDPNLWCWGAGTNGQLGDPPYDSPTPVQMSVSGVQLIAEQIAVGQHCCAIADAGLSCWGLNSSGEVGSACDGGVCLVPQQVQGL